MWRGTRELRRQSRGSGKTELEMGWWVWGERRGRCSPCPACTIQVSHSCLIPASSRPALPALLLIPVPEFGPLLGRAGTMSLGKAVEVLDTLGNSMSNLNPSGSFVSGMVARKTKLTILAFEVANTIVKGSYLMQSFSEESIQILKKEVLLSDGVQRLVSTDMEELLTIAGADKKEELDVFSREVVRFGGLCKDPQWHNLGQYFQKLNSDFFRHKMQKEDAERTMQQLVTMAQHTSIRALS